MGVVGAYFPAIPYYYENLMEQVIFLEYVIVGLQILLIALILALAGVVWFKFGRPASEILEVVNRVVASVSPMIHNEDTGIDQRLKNAEIVVSTRRDLEQASKGGFGKILIVGDLAKPVRQALQLCSQTNLTTIHSAIKQGPVALEMAIEEIKPGLEEIAVIKSQIGTAIVAGLACHYEMDSCSEDGNRLLLKRNR